MDAAVAALRREQVLVTKITPAAAKAAAPADQRPPPRETGQAGVGEEPGRVHTPVSVIIDAGLPLVQCLDILQQEEDKHFAAVILQTRSDSRGRRVAPPRSAMGRHRRPSTVLTNMHHAGEAGILDTKKS